jgi:hypothetical protein
VSVEGYTSLLTVSAIYLPPKPTVKHGQLAAFYNNLGHRFITGGDYNAKDTAWGSRLISPCGREVLKTMEQLNLNHISAREPTYWPSNCKKLHDLLDFCITKCIPRDSALPTSCFDLSSDHSPVLITLNPSVLNKLLHHVYVTVKSTGTISATSSPRTLLSMFHSKLTPKLRTQLSTSMT